MCSGDILSNKASGIVNDLSRQLAECREKLEAAEKALDRVQRGLNGPYPHRDFMHIAENAEEAGTALQIIGKITGEDWSYYPELPGLVQNIKLKADAAEDALAKEREKAARLVEALKGLAEYYEEPDPEDILRSYCGYCGQDEHGGEEHIPACPTRKAREALAALAACRAGEGE